MLAAVAKSAQLGLHGWLSDAMEGPTPVSALIHAATMVTAGVFLIYRCSMILEYAPVVLCLIAFIGAQTALLAASSALVQNDIKKVIALSTRLVIMADRMAIDYLCNTLYIAQMARVLGCDSTYDGSIPSGHQHCSYGYLSSNVLVRPMLACRDPVLYQHLF